MNTRLGHSGTIGRKWVRHSHVRVKTGGAGKVFLIGTKSLDEIWVFSGNTGFVAYGGGRYIWNH